MGVLRVPTMSIQSLTKCMSGLRINTRIKAQTLSSQSSSLCGQKLVSQKAQQVSAVTVETVCGKHKVKTRKAVSKRFQVSGSGKILRRRPGKQHINQKMSRAKLRGLGKMAQVGERDLPNISPNLPYSGVKQSRN